MKRKAFFFGITGALLVMFLAGCSNPTSSNPSGPDTSVLEAGIAAAEMAKAGVLEGEQVNIAQGIAYVSPADMSALATAISAAKALRDNSSATQQAVTNGATALEAAVETFTGGIKYDGTKDHGFDEDELNTLIAAANAAKQGVATSADGADISPSVYWVASGVMNTFNTAVAAAGDAGDIDARYIALGNAITAFKAALRPGAKAKTVTITGLPASANGAVIQVGLFETKPTQGSPQVAGTETIQNGRATVSLYVSSSGSAWAGTGSWYVAFMLEGTEVAYVAKTAKPFSSDNVNVALSECDATETGSNNNRGEKIGEIKGTITLTNIPTPRPTVSIRAANENNYNWSSYHSSVSLSGAGGNTATNIAWTIPVYEHDSNGSLQGQAGTRQVVFSMVVSAGNSSGYYAVDIPGSKTLDLSNLSSMDVGSLGSVSLASVTLSGSITASNAGQPIPRLDIRANDGGQNQELGYTSIQPAALTTQWTITIPAQQGGAVRFSVYGYASPNGGDQLFSKTFAPASTASVTDQPISGIALDAGDISAGALSGTVTFASAPPASSQIRISATYGAGGNQHVISNGSSHSVAVSGAAGTWTIPGDDAFLAALDSGSQTVVFRLSIRPDGSDSSVALPEITKTVSKDALAGINLGSVNIALVTLGGTITATNEGQPVPILYIDALNAGQNQMIGEIRLEPTTAATQWTMTIPAQQGGAVTFRVYGYDSAGSGANQLFSKTFAPAATASVTDQPISGIALDAGDVGVGRLSGIVSFANLPSPPPYRIYVYARWYEDGSNNSKSLASGNRAIITDGTWLFQKDDEFLAALDSGDKRVVFEIYLEINQDESGVRVDQVDTTVGKNNLTSVNLGSIAVPQYIKLSGTFTGSYNGSPLSQVSIYAKNEASGNQLGNSAYISSPAASGSPWHLYVPAPASSTKVVFNVSSYSGNTALFNITVPHPQTASVSNQDVSGIAIDVGNIVPNTLRVANNPSGSYTAYVSDTYITQTNYPSINQSGSHVASGNGSGSSISLSWASAPDNSSKCVLIVAANGVTKYAGWTAFANGIGAVDWDAMTEAVGSKLTISGNPPSGQLAAYVSIGNQITNTNYTAVLDAYRATGTGISPILLAWTPGYGEGAYHVLIKTGSDEYWYKNSVSFTDRAGTINWGEMTKVTQQLPAPANLRVTASTASSISLAWDSVEGASGYHVYRDNSASPSNEASTSHTDSGLSASTTHSYKVAAVASDGTEGAQSSAVSGTTAAAALPAPTGLTVTAATSNTIILAWDSVASASGYHVYRDGSASWSYAASTPYTEYGLNASTTYSFTVAAVASDGTEGPQSSVVSGTTASGDVPPAPGGDTLTVSGYSGVLTVFVTQTTITQENYNSIMSSGFAATGVAASGSIADLIWQGGFSKTSSYNVLLATTDGYRYQNGVSFSDGSATVNYGGMTEIEIGGGGELKTGSLTINGLSSGDTFAVYVFTPGTDISSFTAAMEAFTAQSYQAVGATATSGVFTIVGMNGLEAVDFEASGNLPVLLLNSSGAMIDLGGSAPMYSWASVSFSDGTATASYSSFTGMFMTF
jgi:chitodextrinase